MQRRAATTATAKADPGRAAAELVTQLALQDERSRIAGQLHEVFAHEVSVIVVQSVGGRTVLRPNPEQAVHPGAVAASRTAFTLRQFERCSAAARRAPLPQADYGALRTEGRLSAIAEDE